MGADAMTASRVGAVVVTYRSEPFVGACISALQRSTIPIDIVVVDNGSDDRTVEVIRREHPGVTVVEQDNRGFAAGNNRGLDVLRRNGAAYAFLINPDAVVESDCAERLAAWMADRSNVGIVSPKVHFPDGKTIWFGGATIDWATGDTPQRGNGQPDTGQFDTAEPMERACGAAMLVRMEAAARVGPMPEEYFLYFEETDWSRRFIAAGYELYYVPAAVCRHAVSSSTGRESALYRYYMTRNNMLFMSRYGGEHWPAYRSAMVRRSLRSIGYCFRHPGRRALTHAWVTLRGHTDFLLGRFGRRW
jgi:GT2 family glycosyltransferase